MKIIVSELLYKIQFVLFEKFLPVQLIYDSTSNFTYYNSSFVLGYSKAFIYHLHVVCIHTWWDNAYSDRQNTAASTDSSSKGRALRSALITKGMLLTKSIDSIFLTYTNTPSPLFKVLCKMASPQPRSAMILINDDLLIFIK